MNRKLFSVLPAFMLGLALIAQTSAVRGQTETNAPYPGELTGIWLGVVSPAGAIGAPDAMLLMHAADGELIGVNLAILEGGAPGAWRMMLGEANRNVVGYNGGLLQYGSEEFGAENPDMLITYELSVISLDTLILQIRDCEYQSGIERACPVEIGAQLMYMRLE